MAMNCYICFSSEDGSVEAVAICNDLKKPVCKAHARYCVEEGHGTSPLESQEANREVQAQTTKAV